jgi:hypothetical protein
MSSFGEKSQDNTKDASDQYVSRYRGDLIAEGKGIKALRSLSMSDDCRDMVYREALSRHVSDMEARASEAIRAKKIWTDKLMTDQLRYEIEQHRKRARSRENAEYLLRQMRLSESKRKEDKLKQISDASCHDFPGINDHPPCDRAAAREAHKELDNQVQHDRSLRTMLRMRDLEFANKFQKVNRAELERIKSENIEKKLKHRSVLNEAWNRDLRIKSCWNAIEKFDADNMHECISFMRPHSTR